MRMNRETKRIVDGFAHAVAAVTISNPEEMRRAAAYIRSPAFSADDDMSEVIVAYATALEKSAEHKERILRETFG